MLRLYKQYHIRTELDPRTGVYYGVAYTEDQIAAYRSGADTEAQAVMKLQEAIDQGEEKSNEAA